MIGCGHTSRVCFLTIFAFALPSLAIAQGPATASKSQQPMAFRPPAVPLVTHDPYFSVWSFDNKLTDGWPRHWTGKNHGMVGMTAIDGKPFRFMGLRPDGVPAMDQTGLEVWPTRTIYTFTAVGVKLTVMFTSPLLPDDMDLVSRPVTYVTWTAEATDGKPHEVSIYLDCCAELCVDRPNQQVTPSRLRTAGLSLLRIGTEKQEVLSRSGDDLRIDWGYFYLAIPRGLAETAGAKPAASQSAAWVTNDVIAGHDAARQAFAKTQKLPDGDDTRFPRAVADDWPVLACTLELGKVEAAPVSRHVLLAYDDRYGIEYFGRKLRPYWRRAGMEFDTMIRTAAQQYPSLLERCKAFDEELNADLTAVGGEAYAKLATLAFRQTLAAHKLVVDFNGTPLMFSKENFSNGCIGTVDVFYPAAPFFLLFNPKMMQAQLVPLMDYAASPRWTFPFSPHDLGTYPLANGQVYGGGELTEEDQMPVEESANMLILIAAMAKLDGKANLAKRYPSVLSKWAGYLDDKGYDPANQLCTDDFAGHLAHNTNLSIKAIVALAAYAKTCELAGQAEPAKTYREIADGMATRWMKDAADADHTRLAFDKPGTWSQKYNLVWDRVLGLSVFPPELFRSETAFYRSKLNKYGLPLDNRKDYTKLDWCVWTACLAPERADFEAQMAPLLAFINDSPSRVPLTDWFSTTSAKQEGFQARSVVGGVFIPMLADGKMWEKWSKRAK
jgi:hypothetical protein